MKEFFKKNIFLLVGIFGELLPLTFTLLKLNSTSFGIVGKILPSEPVWGLSTYLLNLPDPFAFRIYFELPIYVALLCVGHYFLNRCQLRFAGKLTISVLFVYLYQFVARVFMFLLVMGVLFLQSPK